MSNCGTAKQAKEPISEGQANLNSWNWGDFRGTGKPELGKPELAGKQEIGEIGIPWMAAIEDYQPQMNGMNADGRTRWDPMVEFQPNQWRKVGLFS